MSDFAKNYGSIVSLFVALASLGLAFASIIIAIIALKISRKIFIYSSKDYMPDIQYSINDNDELDVINLSKDLFTIKSVNFVKIIFVGFENGDHETYVQIPFITKSIAWWWIDETQKISIKEGKGGACAYNLCPYDPKMVRAISDKIHSEYSLAEFERDNKKGYALPSLQSLQYFVEVIYEDSFKKRKSVIYKKMHVHSFGFDNSMIGRKELRNTLKRANIPKFSSIDELWGFLIDKYKFPFNL